MPPKFTTTTLPIWNLFDRRITIDIEHYAWLSRYHWRVDNGPHKQPPRPHAFINYKQVYLARLLTHAPENRFVRHRNGDTLDCTEANLCLVDTRGEAGEPEPEQRAGAEWESAALERVVTGRWPDEMN